MHVTLLVVMLLLCKSNSLVFVLKNDKTCHYQIVIIGDGVAEDRECKREEPGKDQSGEVNANGNKCDDDGVSACKVGTYGGGVWGKTVFMWLACHHLRNSSGWDDPTWHNISYSPSKYLQGAYAGECKEGNFNMSLTIDRST
ncbi:hypothetical protein BC827DRAFT_1159006 [Russula dissimulans]|nr:hypothetical protein BC827DRAFT_1159006 [Russula dissimulans]